MNKYIYSAAAFLSLSCLTLTSCQNEMEQVGAPAGKEVLLRVTANRGDAETRTTLVHDGQGGLVCKWEEGDQLLVVQNSNGAKLGVITITDGVNTPNGTFEGKVNLEGQEALSLVYLGKAGDAEAYTANNIEINLSAQDGSLASLPKLDVLTAEASVDDQNFLPAGNTIETSISMTRQLAFGYFSLAMPDNVVLGEGDVITIAGEGLRSEGKVNFKNGGFIPTVTNYTGSTTITITKAEDGNDFYVTMLPCGDVTPTFTVVKDGVTYTGALGVHNWKAGEYVRAGEEQGVVINMTKVAAIDHSKNPLALWAESDLTRNGSGASATGKFTGSYKTSGYYYQFGRNYGHQSYTAVNSNYDKIGVAKMNSNWTGGTFYTSLYGYVNGSTLANVYNGSGQNQKAKWYSSTTNLASYPEYFLVAGNSNLQNWNGEYVFDTNKQHKQKWAERAKDMGYTNDICPDGYRLPTLEDWKKILPKGGLTYATGATTSFPTKSEIKEDGNIKYAVRWSRVVEGTNTQYLKIDALVVASDVTTTDGINWSDSNVVTRYFKAAGMIRPFFFLAQFVNQGVTSYQWLEKALPEGNLNSTVTSIGAVQVTVSRDDSWTSGYYWVDDANHYYMNFRFDPNNLQQQGSFINVYQPEVPIACNIRCIKK